MEGACDDRWALKGPHEIVCEESVFRERNLEEGGEGGKKVSTWDHPRRDRLKGNAVSAHEVKRDGFAVRKDRSCGCEEGK